MDFYVCDGSNNMQAQHWASRYASYNLPSICTYMTAATSTAILCWKVSNTRTILLAALCFAFGLMSKASQIRHYVRMIVKPI